MLHSNSPAILHTAQSIFLILLSITFLPFSTSILFLSYAVRPFVKHDALRRHLQRSPHFRPKTVLARAFYETGHRVIGADFEPYGIPVSGRFSRALAKFYPLSKPSAQHGATRYIRDLVYIVEKEDVDLWVSCSGVASAVEDGQAMEMIERKTKCKSIQFNVETTATLHEKDTFITYTESLGLVGRSVEPKISTCPLTSLNSRSLKLTKWLPEPRCTMC
jgi:hypothetical protein